MAGILVSYLQNHFFEKQPITRVMPNTSSFIGESATGISIGSSCSDEHISLTKELLTSIGFVFVIPEEKMDLFTSIAASGPAYMFFHAIHGECRD